MSESTPHPWETAWKEGRWQELSPPLPAVYEFIECLKDQSPVIVLDLGCGAGRHTMALAKAGFQVIGLDISETALNELQKRVEKSGFTNVTLVEHDMVQLPFSDDYFDAVVSTNVLHHGTIRTIEKTITELHRIMKPGARSLIVTLSKRDFRYGDGDKLETDTFRFTEGDEKGIIHHFFDESGIGTAFSKFEIEDLVEELIPVEEGNRAHYFLTIAKA